MDFNEDLFSPARLLDFKLNNHRLTFSDDANFVRYDNNSILRTGAVALRHRRDNSIEISSEKYEIEFNIASGELFVRIKTLIGTYDERSQPSNPKWLTVFQLKNNLYLYQFCAAAYEMLVNYLRTGGTFDFSFAIPDKEGIFSNFGNGKYFAVSVNDKVIVTRCEQSEGGIKIKAQDSIKYSDLTILEKVSVFLGSLQQFAFIFKTMVFQMAKNDQIEP